MLATKMALVAALAILAALAFPLGALLAARRVRARHGRTRLRRDLSGAQVAGILLHREGLSGISVGAETAQLEERYCPSSGRVLLAEDSARGRSVYAAAAAAFLCARVTLHADGDADFARAHRRRHSVALLANLTPAAALAGLCIPGEGRALLLVVAPGLALWLILQTLLSLPSDRMAAERALNLLSRHGLCTGEEERDALREALASRASLGLAAPMKKCFWVNWAL